MCFIINNNLFKVFRKKHQQLQSTKFAVNTCKLVK